MLRFDLAGSLGRIRHNADGSITVPGVAARVHRPGDGLAYPQPDGTTAHEYRDADELRSIVAQLPGTKVTLRHPRGLVRAGSPAHIAGIVEAARIDGDNAEVDLKLHDRVAIDEVTSRRVVQLSLGYGCNVDARGYQRNIQLDHLALVEAARCGDQCSLQLDHAPAGVNMDPQLLEALKLVNVRTDGLAPRDIALAILRECKVNLDDATSNGQPITAREDAYVIARAYYQSQSYKATAQRHADAASFATVKPSPPAPVMHTDCGCGGKPSHVDADLEREARARNARSSRLAWAQGGEHADEAEAIDRIREQTARPFVPSTPRRGDAAPVDELAARQAMHAWSRNAHTEPSPDPLATDKDR